jgi:hypothetical protein
MEKIQEMDTTRNAKKITQPAIKRIARYKAAGLLRAAVEENLDTIANLMDDGYTEDDAKRIMQELWNIIEQLEK